MFIKKKTVTMTRTLTNFLLELKLETVRNLSKFLPVLHCPTPGTIPGPFRAVGRSAV